MSEYLSNRSFSITVIIVHKATGGHHDNRHVSVAVGVSLGLGIPPMIAAIWQITIWSIRLYKRHALINQVDPVELRILR
jgi:hypothetical protein